MLSHSQVIVEAFPVIDLPMLNRLSTESSWNFKNEKVMRAMERDILRVLQVCVALVVLLIVAMLFAWLFPMTEGHAAWAQAIGGLVAIVAAIVIPTRIHLTSQQDSLSQRKDARDLMVGSLLAEVRVLTAGFEQAIGNRIAIGKDVSGYVDSYWPPERPFSVYDGCVARIAEIEPAVFAYFSDGGHLVRRRGRF